MYSSQLINGAYRAVRDDGLVIAEVAGKNQIDPCSDGNLVAWASFSGPPYVICSRTVDGSTLGPIVQQTTNTNEHAIRPFLANGWLFWSQCRNGFSTWAKNLSSGKVVGPWTTSPNVGGVWSWAATANRALAINTLHWGKNYNPLFITAVMFDFVTGNFVTFDQLVNPNTLNLAQTWYPNGLLLRSPDFNLDWANAAGDVVSLTNNVSGSDFIVTFSINQRSNDVKAISWNLWQRIVHENGMMEIPTSLQSVLVEYDPKTGEIITQIPSWL